MADEAPNLVEIGFVARAHGVRGQLRVVLHDASSNPLEADVEVFVAGDRYRVVEARPVNDAVLLTLEGVADRNVAEGLRGKKLEVDRDLLALDGDDVLLADLVGVEVIDAHGDSWGRVETLQLGPQDLLVVVDDDGVERLVPVVDELITDIDLEAGVIRIDVPDDWPSTVRGK